MMTAIQVGQTVKSTKTGLIGTVESINKERTKATVRTTDYSGNEVLSSTTVTVPLAELKPVTVKTTTPKDVLEEYEEELEQTALEVVLAHVNAINALSDGNNVEDSMAQLISKLKDAYTKESQVDTPTTDLDSLVAKVDALTDTNYFINGTFVEIGVKPKQDVKNNLPTERYPNEHRLFHQVAEFHKVGGHPVAQEPVEIGLQRLIDRTGYTSEEIVEFLHSMSRSQEEFKQRFDKFFSLVQLHMQNLEDTDTTVVDELNKAHKATLKLFDLINMPSTVFGDIVHNANMTKFYINDEGEYYAKTRESDGKILKSPDFVAPEPLIRAKVEELLSK